MIGTGYVGLVTGTCLADFGHTVVCVDIDESRIDQLNQGEMPIYEPGLKDVVARNHRGGRLRFTTDLGEAVRESEVVFIAVGTPSRDDGGTDLSYVYTAAEDVAKNLDGYTVIVQKSTAPVGTARKVGDAIAGSVPEGAEFDMVSNPEFLREGSAVEDFMRPNRVVIGAETDRAREMMSRIYRPLYLLETPIVNTGLETAEMVKYASNSFLATKISFINEMATICELVGANVDDVARGMGLDGRIGRKFLHAGIGYGGSCLPKDVSSLLHVAREHGYEAALVRAANDINDGLVERAFQKLEAALGGCEGKTVALWDSPSSPTRTTCARRRRWRWSSACWRRGPGSKRSTLSRWTTSAPRCTVQRSSTARTRMTQPRTPTPPCSSPNGTSSASWILRGSHA